MKRILATLVLVLVAGCSEQQAETPQPFALTQEAIGRYCGMNVLEHEGPKGQIILSQIPEPIWFSSARDAVAFTLLPDEPKAIAAIYVSDMGAAASWAQPGAENWIDARTAFYVIGSTQRGGMGVAETIPFSRERDARDFAGKHGGEVVVFPDIPSGYVLGDGQANDGADQQREEAEQ
ncbi:MULTISPECIES: nitrous oxide reductase accessory protein NosL [unclassified Shinella]|jgi:copper chaperone NosL|uniref:nitrous oxide reductase accessory protein NosL n=1 Tax=unclassified Shinella TaxID=2643062 RepID=UPI000682961C|nr:MULTISPECIES: nitrous oxide reductase accessory protein NosL [unclassified Shinella]KNY15154.1 copper chaperone [Shinella sp. SUS2]KOC73040.1 copper resistance protein CopZ [Shinella sp. GWS1]MCO5151749.1 nitrous oxide reductase accessory protein NosL [Shinella sp.]MDC7266494.1 nitrous oxide reductase accessory protein NosL [Shinella sp. HY16]MDC7273391.1 nitrous oxide reductase accessory protein NosL [Shinella sp. YZ44]